MQCYGIILFLSINTFQENHFFPTKAISGFATSVYQYLQTQEGNILVSPLSIQITLGMLQNGAGDKTLQQIAEGGKLSAVEVTNKDMAALKSKLHKIESKDVTVDCFNTIFIDETIKLRDSFIQSVAKSYNATTPQVDFSYAQEAADQINNWTALHTHNKLKNVFKSEDFSRDTAIVLLNALYFKGSWKKPFDKNNTKLEDFNINLNENKKIKFMELTAGLRALNSSYLESWIIELPFMNDKLAMLVIIPHKINGLGDIEGKLTDFKKMLQGSTIRELELRLPKFKIKQKINLKPLFEKLGMIDVFEPKNANFTNMTSSSEIPVYISKGTQDCIINIDEKGAEAVAVTGVSTTLTSFLPTPVVATPVIIADRPFLFTIVFKKSKLPLFIGRFSSP